MLYPAQMDPAIRAALAEDLGSGDMTTRATLAGEDPPALGRIVAKEDLVVAGLPVAARTFELVDPSVEFTGQVADGTRVAPGTCLAELRGGSAALLAGERVALNFLMRLSGVATLVRRYRDAMGDSKAVLLSTRKTTPGLRALESHAVLMGGGTLHRTGLHTGVLIKSNHVHIAGSVGEAVRRARRGVGPILSVEVEVRDLDELGEAIDAGADVALLDNLDLDGLREAVAFASGRIRLEASGGVRLETAGDIAATGVHAVSCGRLTHSATSVDIHMVVEPAPGER
jgi:nicotinate-nucleotide pyrophosphorylase (carboxylating)